jgi:MHS family proline/betaine transporter-like MFS transporter
MILHDIHTAYIFIISLFSAEERFTGVAFSYNLGVALFGGTSAVISRWLVEVTHLYHAPAFYVMITSLLFLAMAYSMKKTIIRLIDTNLKPK